MPPLNRSKSLVLLVLRIQTPLTFGNLPTSAANTLTIRPESGATHLSVTSANITAATVDLNGARFITFDGRPGGVGTAKELTLANTSTSGVAVRFINEASSNTLRFMNLQGVNSSATSGTVVFSTTTGANGNDNNTIEACDLRDDATPPANALFSAGSTGTTAQSNSGNTVSNCNVFNFHSASSDAAGMRLEGGNIDWSITGNSFYQTASRAAVATNVRGIFINNNSGSHFTVTGNSIGGSAPGAGGTAWMTTGTAAPYRFAGMQLNVGSTMASNVQGNSIKNMVWTNSMDSIMLPGIWRGIYAQSGDVNIGTQSGNIIGSGTGSGSISVTPSVTGGTTFGIGSTSSGTVAIAKFIRRADYVAAGLTYRAQFSADLFHWETDNTTPTVLATDGVNQVAGLVYPTLSGGAQARFFRLVVGLQ